MRYPKRSLILALLVLPYLGEATPIDSTRVELQSGNTLPHEEMSLPNRLDHDLEKLLEKWYDGYSKRSTATGESVLRHQPVPNLPDSVYIGMLERIPSVIRLSYNPIVRETIELYLFKRRSLLSSMLSLANLYFPEIEMVLDQHKLPLELKYLTIVESALNPSARSHMGAAGLWQLMLPTARFYGLKINSLVDERLDPSKSTLAASKLLAELYGIYNDWWLAIAAYNCGPGNVNKAIRRSGKNAPTFWDIYAYLPKETRRYVPLFIGAYFSMYYHRYYQIEARELGNPVATEYYQVEEDISFHKISELTGVSEEQIRVYNPQFHRGIIPGKSEAYALRLPLHAVMKLEGVESEDLKSESLAVELVSPKESPKASHKRKTHRVRKGETLARIAKRYGVTQTQLRQWNGIKKSGKVKAGQMLIVSK